MKVLQIDEQIKLSDEVICRYLDKVNKSNRGEVSQDILAQLRHFVEHIILKIYADGNDIEDIQTNTQKSVNYIKSRHDLQFIARLHSYLQITVAHRVLSEENSERLMLKYYEYLLRIKNYLFEQYSMVVLENLSNFPIEIDENYEEYYGKIAEKVDCAYLVEKINMNRFYIQKIKPFFYNDNIYYEVAFVSANDNSSKTDCSIAFTNIDISSNYAVKLAFIDDSIELLNKSMPIKIIVDWEVSIRPCEFGNFNKLFYKNKIEPSKVEQENINEYLTRTGISLSSLMDYSDKEYSKIRKEIVPNTKAKHFFDTLDVCRDIIKEEKAGSNIIKYLLYKMTNRIIKAQFGEIWVKNYNTGMIEYIGKNKFLSQLYIDNRSIAFDNMPFCSGLRGHVPNFWDLVFSLDIEGREHELLARTIENNAKKRKMLFTPLEKNRKSGKYELGSFKDVGALAKIFNKNLYDNETQQARKLIIKNNYICIEGYKNDTISIINSIKNLTKEGVDNYSNAVKHWLNEQSYLDISDEKKIAMQHMFESSRVSVIYGAAGTGKTTLISCISSFFKDYSKLYLAHTHSAVNNLRRRVEEAKNSKFMTVSKFNKKFDKNIDRTYDILIIDECSTINNREMKELLELAKFKLLILVGDVYQIEAIEFGNWFDLIRYFLPKSSICELKVPFRSENQKLLKLWSSVRENKDDILDRLQGGGYSSKIDESIFTPLADNEIILCLNYGGLYGINNINHFMQESNTGKEIRRGIKRYKVGDPILFNELADSFFSTDSDTPPIIYNNMKAKIYDFRVLNKNTVNESIQFDIEIDRPLIELNDDENNFKIVESLENGHSIIRFEVYKNKSTDEDDDGTSVVPFQVSYAVSIHKAQGLEYDSVKIIITDEIDELISHNIFYTAITRAKVKLKIYWAKDVERQILEQLEITNNHRDISLLKNEII